MITKARAQELHAKGHEDLRRNFYDPKSFGELCKKMVTTLTSDEYTMWGGGAVCESAEHSVMFQMVVTITLTSVYQNVKGEELPEFSGDVVEDAPDPDAQPGTDDVLLAQLREIVGDDFILGDDTD
jgi:hypothetical protein